MASASNSAQSVGCLGIILHPDLLSIVRRERGRSILGSEIHSEELLKH